MKEIQTVIYILYPSSSRILIGNVIFNGGEDKNVTNAIKKIKNKETPVFSKVEEENKGIFVSETETETNYYFHGNVNNNWVKFGEENGEPIY